MRAWRRAVPAVAGALLGALLGAGLVTASIPGGDGLVTACYTTRTGALRIVDASVACATRGEARLTWPSAAVKTATIDAARHLVLTYTDGTTADLGDVTGPAGPPLGSLDSLAGLPCAGGTGTTVVDFGTAADPRVTLSCRPSTVALTVRLTTSFPLPIERSSVTVGTLGTCTGDGTYGPVDCPFTVAGGTSITLTVTSGFAGWGPGPCLGVEGPVCTFEVDAAATVEVSVLG